MAGVQAGRLSIEIVAEIARLQQDLDKAKRLVGAASKDIASSARHANDNLAGMAGGIGKAGGQSKIAAHHLSNLSFQLQDIVVGLKSGQKPMTIFLQQGSQIAQIMGQAGIGVGGLAKAVGGMVFNFAKAHPILLAISAAAGVVAAGFGLVTEEINKTAKTQVTMTDVLLGTFDVIKDAVVNGVAAAFKAMGIDIAVVWEAVKKATKDAINFVIGAAIAVPKLIAATYDKIPAAFGDAFYSAANLAIEALNWLVKTAGDSVNVLVDTFNSVFGTEIPRVITSGINSIANPYKGAMAALGSAGAKSLSESFGRDYLGDFAGAVSGAAQARARTRLEAEAEKLGKGAGKKAGRAAGKEMAEEMAMSFQEAFKGFEIPDGMKEIWGDNAQLRETLDGLATEAKLVGMVGWERERLLLILEHEAAIRPILSRLATEENQIIIDGLKAQLDLQNEVFRTRIQSGNAEAATEKLAAANDNYNESLRDTVDLLRDIGGLGGVLGNLLGFLTGDFDGMSGALGYLLKTQIKGRDGELRKLGDVLKESLGSLGDTLTDVIKGAGVGMAASTALFGKQGTTGQLGSAIGGALGEKLGSKFLTKGLETIAKGLGDFAGPIGSIVGGILGGVVGKLLGGTARGSAIISGGKVSGSYGNNAQFKDQAGQIAGGVLDTLQQIAQQFNTTLNNAAAGGVSIGIRDGKYAVDTLGRGYTKSSIAGVKSFGTDAEAAAQYAIKLMLERGAIAMREGSMKIIKNASDLQEGLTRALQFEEIMGMLENGTGQLVGQVKAIRTAFEQYISVMKEAGSSVEDLTRVQEMQAQRIKELLAQAGASFRGTFYSDSQNLEFAKQQIAGVLGPLGKAYIDTVGEYIAEVEAAQKDTTDAGLAWLDTLYQLGDAFGTLKDASEAAAAQREADRQQREADRAAAAAERARQIDEAKSVLKTAYDRQADVLEQTAERFNAFADSMADLKAELFAGEGAADGYAQKLAELRRVGALAGMGDEASLGAVPGVGRDFLGASKNRAGSLLEYQRDIALVARYASTVETAARGMATEAQKQLAALDKQVSKLIDIDENVISVEQAIRDLIRLQGGGSSSGSGGSSSRPDWFPDLSGGLFSGGLSGWFDRLGSGDFGRDRSADGRLTVEALDRVEQRLAAQEEHGRRTADSVHGMNRLLQSVTRDGTSLTVATDADTPIATVSA